MEDFTRRDFIKGVVGAGLSLAVADGMASVAGMEGVMNPYDPKGLPTVRFGNTGVVIPKIVLGLGSRFCHIDSEEEAHGMLNHALDKGFYYWDTAHIYDNTIAGPPGKAKPAHLVVSEERLGAVVKHRRKEIFLSTKVAERDPDKAMKQIELSLKRLNTDKLDMLKVHDVKSPEDVEQMSQKGHLISILQKLKEEGVTRFIGFSCHGNAEALKEMANRAEFDSMLFAMNHYNPRQPQTRQETAIPEGKRKGMGILLMKAVRPKETIEGLTAPDLVRYALSLEGPDAVVVGMDSKAVVDSNAEILQNFKKLSPRRMQELADRLEPFYHHKNLPWMQEGYMDGNWKS